jgi:aminomethyltransferase
VTETPAPPLPPPLHSPLHSRHEAAGATWADFGGWSMPLSFSGIVEEHTAVREAVGIFDVSHLGNASVAGPGAVAWLNGCLTNDLDRIEPGRVQYTLCCDDETGGVVDDLMAYLVSPDRVDLVPNAANTPEVLRRLREAAPEGVEVRDEHTDFAVLAVQGPLSTEVLRAAGLPTDLDYLQFTDASYDGVPVRIARAGYTGERGYELVVASESAGALWDRLVEQVLARGGRRCGLGARDTLRTEMGYPLHGQDLSVAITPVEARLGWAVGWKKPAFWGRDALTAQREAGAPRLLWGIRLRDRGIPRPHMTVRSAGDEDVGEVTSGTFSPTLHVGIALALLTRQVVEGDDVVVDVRGRAVAGQVVSPPFVPASTK